MPSMIMEVVGVLFIAIGLILTFIEIKEISLLFMVLVKIL